MDFVDYVFRLRIKKVKSKLKREGDRHGWIDSEIKMDRWTERVKTEIVVRQGN